MPILKKNAVFFENSDCQILCVGDIMLDKYIYGNVSRISPEAPVPVFHLQSTFEMLGGLGNVVSNLSGFLGKPIVVGAIGADEGGNRIKEMMNSHHKSFLVTSPKTSVKTRYVSNGQQLLRVDDEVICSLTPEQIEHIGTFIKEVAPSTKAIILSDYDKGVLTPELCHRVIEIAKIHSLPVLVDPKGTDYTKYTGATFLTPNLKEFTKSCGQDILSSQCLVQNARRLIDQYQLQGIIITQGPEGMTFVTKEEDLHIKATTKEVFDVPGAGDTVIATLAIAIAKGVDPKSACILANAAAGVVVSKAGTATVSLEELQQALSLDPIHSYEEKIIPLSSLEAVVQTWRHQNLKVGFTNGCYDLLHKGHLRCLREAKYQCDRLIVAVNTDYSVKRLKGFKRPIQTQEVRSLVLAALELVDAVILFDQETPLYLIETIIPDILVKGADYTVEEVIGSDIVLRNGGRVHLVQLEQGQSTTNLVSKMNDLS